MWNRARLRLLLLPASLLLAAPVAGQATAAAASPDTTRRTFLVVPFENVAHTPELDWVGESFAVALEENLAAAGDRVVAREDRLAALERLGLPAGAPLTHASLLRLGEELGADMVVGGEFQVTADQLQTRAWLLSVSPPALSAPLTEEGTFARLVVIQKRLAWDILRRLDGTFPYGFDEFQRRLPAHRTSAFESYVRGLLAMNREQQRRYFLQAARLDSSYAEPVVALARLSFEDQDYGTASTWFAKVAADDPLSLEAQFYLSLCQFYSGEYEQAVATLSPVATRLPAAAVWNNLGVYASRQKSQDAPRYFARALEAAPDDSDVYFNLGLYYLRGERWQEAAQALGQAVQLNLGDTEAYFLRSNALAQLGQTQEAARARALAVGDNPALDLSLERRELNLDRVAQSLHASPGAGRRRQSLLASARAEHLSIHLERARDDLVRGALESAQRELAQAVALDPGSYAARFLLGRVYEQQGRLDAAAAELQAALSAHDTVEARLRLAHVFLAQQRPQEARRQVDSALALDPASVEARRLSAQLPPRTATSPGEETTKP